MRWEIANSFAPALLQRNSIRIPEVLAIPPLEFAGPQMKFGPGVGSLVSRESWGMYPRSHSSNCLNESGKEAVQILDRVVVTQAALHQTMQWVYALLQISGFVRRFCGPP